jgi:Flp pilus assembly protein TadG
MLAEKVRAVGRRRGAAAAEFAVLCPLLFIILFGVVDVCRFFYVSMKVTECAQSAATYASSFSVQKGSPYSSAQDAAVKTGVSLAPAVDPNNVQISAPFKDANDNLCITATVTYSFDTITHLTFGQSIVFSRTVQMRVTN